MQKNGKFYLFEKIPANYAFSFFEDDENNLWVLTSQGLFIIKEGKLCTPDLPEELKNIRVEVMLKDIDGNYWFGTRQKGLYRFYDGKIENLSLKEGLTSLWIYGLCLDHEGSLWIGTMGGGIVRLKETRFLNLTKYEGLSDDQIWNLVEDKDGKIWIRSMEGISYFDGKKIINKNFKEFKKINPIVRDVYGNLWINDFEKGIAEINEEKILRKFFFKEIENVLIWCMFAKKDGSLYLGSTNGMIYKFNNGKIEVLESSKKLNGIIRCFYEDKKGNFYVGYDGGLGILKNNEIYLKETNAIVNSIFEDSSGNFWIGTENKGIFLLKNDHFFEINSEKGLFNNSILSILEDDNKNLWLGTRNGILSSSIDEMVKTATGKKNKLNCKVFGIQDGMKTIECNGGFQPSSIKTKDGKIFFPTNKGVVIVDPEKLKKNDVLPKVYIEELKVDENLFEGPFPLKFGPGVKKLEFKFTALSFLFPEKVLFKYKLEGYDREWVDCGNKRETFYTNLPPGKYKFKVIACNNDGLWNQEGATLSFTLLPFYYQTIYFKILLIFLFAGAIFGFVKYKIYQIKKRSRELEKLIDLRTKELKEEKEKEEKLLLNILPQEIVSELKNKGFSPPKNFQSVSIMFTDFKGFTTISATLPPEELVKELNDIYSNFDIILEKYKLEKIRTLGDSYMVVSGLPVENKDHAINLIKAALKMQEYLKERNKREAIKWQMRVGIHSGQVTAGIVGKTKFAYDVWGDTVNIAARMEQAGEAEKINISAFTYYLVKEKVEVELRGKIEIKGKGEVDMYFVSGLKE